MVAAKESLDFALIRPVANRRRWVVFSGPWLVRMVQHPRPVPVEDFVMGLDTPVPKVDGKQALGSCAVRGMIGEGIVRRNGGFAGLLV